MTLLSQPIGNTGKDQYTVICDLCNSKEEIPGNNFGILSERSFWNKSDATNRLGYKTIKEDDKLKDYCSTCKESLHVRT